MRSFGFVSRAKIKMKGGRKMQKRKILCLLLLMIIFAGCGAKEDKNVANSEEVLEVAATSAILDTKVSTEDDVLYYIPNETIESGFMQDLTTFHGKFLVSGFSEQVWEERPENAEFKMLLISMITGEVEAERTFTNLDVPNIQECGEYLAITDWSDGKVILLDDKLQEVDSYQVACDYNAMYISPDGKKAYVFRPYDGLEITNLSTGKVEVTLENTLNLFTANECGNVVTFSYTDRKTQLDECGALNLTTGEIKDVPFEGSFYNVGYANDTWLATRMEEVPVQYIGNGDEINILKIKGDFSNIEMCLENKGLLSKRYDADGFLGMSLYSMDGKFISKYENSLQGADTQNSLVWSEIDNGFFFLMMDVSGKDKLMFWDMSKVVSGEDLTVQPFFEEQLPEEAVSKALYERAEEIGEKYGIEIRIAEQLDEDYLDFKVETMLDENQIEVALDVLEKGLSIYPENFLKQLLYGSIREIELHLGGALTSLTQPEGEVNGFASYAGFAQERYGKNVFVLDISDCSNLEAYLHHELFHLVEYKLNFDAMIREEAIYSEEEWMKLNPEGFSYADSTYILPEEIYNEEYDVWFIDIYSRTTPKEDRARIMEYAMLGDYNMFILAPHRQAKLEYLNRCIRDAFDTTGWLEKTVWEETLDQSHMYD